MASVVDKDYEIIVVDDGSKDKTYEIAKGFDIKILRHKKNLGKGAAMMTGVENATGEYVVFIDADNTYPAENIPQIVENLDQGYDMVVGSRFVSPDQIIRLNRIGNKLLGSLLKSIYRSKTSDPFSGFYGIKRKHLLNMDIVSKGFEIETEITIKSSRMDLKILDIPIQYGKRVGETKLNPIKDGYRIMITLLNFMMLYSPMIVFAIPGVAMLLFGLGAMILLLSERITVIMGFSIHSLVLASLLSILGFQLVVSGLSSKMYAVLHKFSILDPVTKLFIRYNLINVMKIVGLLYFIVGFYLGLKIVLLWVNAKFGEIMYLENAIVASTLMILGIQSIFSSLFLSIFVNDLDKRIRNE